MRYCHILPKVSSICFFVMDFTQEEWRAIKGYEGMYEVSDLGRVRSIDRHIINNGVHGKSKIIAIKGRVLSQYPVKDGYLCVFLNKDGTPKRFMTHRLVVEAFIPKDDSRLLIDHINTIRTDNRLCNLRRCTASENAQNPLTRQHYREHIEKFGTDAYRRKFSLKEREWRRQRYSGEGNPMYGKTHKESSKQKMREKAQRRTPKNYKRVAQYTNKGELVKVWEGVVFAAVGTGIHKSSISGCCRGENKSAGGFVWKYIEKNDNTNRG